LSFSTDPWEHFETSGAFSLQVATPGKRFLAWALNWLIAAFSFGIVWLIWWIIIFKKGLTPGRQIMKLKVIDIRSLEEVSLKRVFIRGTILYFLLFNFICSILGSIFFGLGFLFLTISSTLMFGKSRQALWDLLTNTTIGIDEG